MAELVTDCPRCRAIHTTFDVYSALQVTVDELNWQRRTWEAFCACRNCKLSTTFRISDKSAKTKQFLGGGPSNAAFNITDMVDVDDFLSLKDISAIQPPSHLPPKIEAAFREGATCLAVGCPNAAATMFRLCIDFATVAMLPNEDVDGLNSGIRWSLGLRMKWLLDTNRLPEALRELSTSVKEDGNDGAHAGTLTKADAEDLLDFATALLERLYTEPERLRLAQVRRQERRGQV